MFTLSLTSSLLLIGILQIAFILKTLSYSRLSQHKRLELQFFFLLLGLSFANSILMQEHFYLHFPSLILLLSPFCLLLSVFFHLYILRNTYPSFELSFTSTRKHFILFVIVFILLLPFHFLYDAETKIAYLEKGIIVDNYMYMIVYFIKPLNIMVNLFYAILTWRRIAKHHLYLKKNFSEVSDYSFIWIQKMLMAFVFIVLICALSLIFNFSFLEDVPMVLWIIAFNWQIMSNLKKSINVEKKKIKVSSLHLIMTQEELKMLSLRLDKCVEEKQLYLNLTLTLEDIATELSMSRHKISEVLNHYKHLSFYEYINQKRILKAQELLCSSTYEGNFMMLSLDCGFKSRSVFYTSFKKYSNMTPSAYKKVHNLSV